MHGEEEAAFTNTRLIASSTSAVVAANEHVCNNKTDGVCPWGADGPTFRYMKNESTSGLLTRLDNFTTEFNTKWNNDAGCNASSPVACTNTGTNTSHCPEVKLDDEDFMGLYKSHSSHRIWFQRYNGFGESFDYNATAFSEWGLFDKLGIIYDYLIESDSLQVDSRKPAVQLRGNQDDNTEQSPWHLPMQNSSASARESWSGSLPRVLAKC